MVCSPHAAIIYEIAQSAFETLYLAPPSQQSTYSAQPLAQYQSMPLAIYSTAQPSYSTTNTQSSYFLSPQSNQEQQTQSQEGEKQDEDKNQQDLASHLHTIESKQPLFQATLLDQYQNQSLQETPYFMQTIPLYEIKQEQQKSKQKQEELAKLIQSELQKLHELKQHVHN